MKNILSLFLLFAFTLSNAFAQEYIGMSKSEVMKHIKPGANKVEKSNKNDDGSYDIEAYYDDGYVVFNFNKKNICEYFMLASKYNEKDYTAMIKNADEKYKRLENTSRLIWKDYRFDLWDYVYYWLIRSKDKQFYLLVTIKKSDFERYEKDLMEVFSE